MKRASKSRESGVKTRRINGLHAYPPATEGDLNSGYTLLKSEEKLRLHNGSCVNAILPSVTFGLGQMFTVHPSRQGTLVMGEAIPDHSGTITGYTFQNLTLRLDTETLVNGGRTIKLRPQSFDVLRYLIEHRDRLVTKDELHENIWGDTVVTDSSLRQCLIEIRKVIGDSSKQMIRTVPRRGVILDMPVQEYVADTSATATSDVYAPIEARRNPVRDLRFSLLGRRTVVSVLALAAASLALIITFQTGPPHSAGTASVTTLASVSTGKLEITPLVMHGIDQDANEMVAMAASMFSVALNKYGLSTVLAEFVQPNDSVPELAVHSMLFHNSDRHYVDVRLSDAVTGTSIWTRRYAGTTGDSVERLLEQSATQTAYAIECGLFRRALIPRPISPELFGLWIRACVHSVNQERVEYYEQMLEIAEVAPQDAASHAAVANAILRLAAVDRTFASDPDLLRDVQIFTERALEIEPEFAEALLVLADAAPFGKWQEQEDLILRAFQSDPSYKWNRSQYLRFLQRVGRLEDAVHYARRTTSLMRGPNHMSLEAWLLAHTGRVAEAISILDKSERAWPEDILSPEKRFNIHAFFGDPAEAKRLLGHERLLAFFEDQGSLGCWLLLLEHRLGRGAVDISGIRSQCHAAPNYLLPRVLAAVGDVDSAIAEIDSMFNEWDKYSHPNITMFLFNPEMAAVRKDSRFMSLAERSGLATYWLQTGERPDFCKQPNLSYDCDDAVKHAAFTQTPIGAQKTRAMTEN